MQAFNSEIDETDETAGYTLKKTAS